MVNYFDKDKKKRWAFTSRQDTNYRFTLHHLQQDFATLLLNGPISNNSLYVLLHKLPDCNSP